MADISWYINRLRAMRPAEVAWRIQQKFAYRADGRRAGTDCTSRLLYPALEQRFGPTAGTLVSPDALPLEQEPFTGFFGTDPQEAIFLPGGYPYEEYRTRWHAGFNTPAEWPLQPANSLRYKQRDDIGDARINWELNRGYQFALLARRGDTEALGALLDSWAAANPWLTGIAWTSVMEVAIRAIQFTVAAWYLSRLDTTPLTAKIKRQLETGALNMAQYVERHYSRYSSANNHLLVEACCLAVTGHALGVPEWVDTGMRLLDEQLERQTFPDGVNREQSLHYQTFAMEAYALAVIVTGRLPQRWVPLMSRMCEFVAWSTCTGTPMEWGDNDHGKILDLKGGSLPYDHYAYVLRLYAHLGIYTEAQHPKGRYKQFPDGGYTFMRSPDGRSMLGIDHGPLGFGSIAAHGHADALSIQLIADGRPLLIDSGTYTYHCNLPERNRYRSTAAHNTVAVGGADQSRMLGAFMWGRRARARCNRFEVYSDKSFEIEVTHTGYAPCIHTRIISGYIGSEHINLTIADRLGRPADATVNFHLPAACRASLSGSAAAIAPGSGIDGAIELLTPAAAIALESVEVSPEFGISEQATRLTASYTAASLIETNININITHGQQQP